MLRYLTPQTKTPKSRRRFTDAVDLADNRTLLYQRGNPCGQIRTQKLLFVEPNFGLRRHFLLHNDADLCRAIRLRGLTLEEFQHTRPLTCMAAR